MTTIPPSARLDDAPPAYAIVDAETDGLDNDRQAWEVAIIRRTPTIDDPAGLAREEVFHAFVELDLRPDTAEVLAIGRFWDRHPLGRDLTGKPPTVLGGGGVDGPALMSVEQAARRVHQLLAGVTMVGVNPAFDAGALGNLLRAAGLPDQPWHYHLEDLIAETVGYLRRELTLRPLAAPEFVQRIQSVTTRPWKSTDLADAIGVEPTPHEQRHQALADARWAARWHDRLAGLR